MRNTIDVSKLDLNETIVNIRRAYSCNQCVQQAGAA